MSEITYEEYIFKINSEEFNQTFIDPYDILRVCLIIYRKVTLSYGLCHPYNSDERHRMIGIDNNFKTIFRIMTAVISQPINASLESLPLTLLDTRHVELQYITIIFEESVPSDRITLFNLKPSSLALLNINTLISLLDTLAEAAVKSISDKLNPQGSSMTALDNSLRLIKRNLAVFKSQVLRHLSHLATTARTRQVTSVVLKMKFYERELNINEDICLL